MSLAVSRHSLAPWNLHRSSCRTVLKPLAFSIVGPAPRERQTRPRRRLRPRGCGRPRVDRAATGRQADGGLVGISRRQGRAGERPEDTLIRELKEELGIIVDEACLAPLTFASHSYPQFHLLMPLYVCRRWQGTVMALEGQKLAWVRPNRLRDYPMPPADEPLVSHLMTLL